MLIRHLIERWGKDDKLKHTFKKIKNVFKNGGKLTTVPIHTESLNGRLDLRGVNVDKLKITECEFSNIDLSYSTFKYCWVENSFFENCLFKKVDFSGFSDHQNRFNDCSFIDCKFNYAAFGYNGTKFTRSLFERCKFTNSIFIRPEFIDVLFENCRIENIDFNASSFENCSFTGKLNDVWFRGGFALKSDYKEYGIHKRNEMKNVSFENAILENLTFSDNCDLSTVKVADSGNYLKYNKWRKRLESLKSESKFWEEKEIKETEMFVNTYMVHAKNQEWYIINMADLKMDYRIKTALKIVNQLNNCVV